MESDDEPVEVYIDGSRSNSKKAGIGIWWGTSDKRNYSARSRQLVCHSNATELEALIVFLERIGARKVSDSPPSRGRHFIVKTDSTNAISSAIIFIPAYREQGWQHCKSTQKPLLRYLDILLRNAQSRQIQITLKYVPGHSGNAGNTGADRLAKAGAQLPKPGARDWVEEKRKLFKLIAAAEQAAPVSRKRKRQEEEDEEEQEEEDEDEEEEEHEEEEQEEEEQEQEEQESLNEGDENQNEDEESDEEEDDDENEGAAEDDEFSEAKNWPFNYSENEDVEEVRQPFAYNPGLTWGTSDTFRDPKSDEDSDMEDDDTSEGVDAQPPIKTHTSEDEESDDEEDSESDNQEDTQGSERDDESSSEEEDDDAESSEEDVVVQPAAKKRKLNTGDATIPSKRKLSQTRAARSFRRKRTNRKARRAALADSIKSD